MHAAIVPIAKAFLDSFYKNEPAFQVKHQTQIQTTIITSIKLQQLGALSESEGYPTAFL